MSNCVFQHGSRIFGLPDLETWLDRLARKVFGISGAEFEAAYLGGDLSESGAAHDLGSVLPLIRALRERERAGG